MKVKDEIQSPAIIPAAAKTGAAITLAPLDSNGELELETIQSAVGGYFEIVRLYQSGRGRIMLVNEDGLQKRLPVNSVASDLAGQTIVGDVILCHESHLS